MYKSRKFKIIEKHLKEQNFEKIKELINRFHPSDSAIIISSLSDQEIPQLIRIIDYEKNASIYEKLDPEIQLKIFFLLDIKEISEIVQLMSSDKIADLLEKLPEKEADMLKNLMTSEEAEEAYQLLKYPKDSAGGIMSKDFIYVRVDQTLGQVLKVLKGVFPKLDVQRANYVYVVDKDKKLAGVLQMRDLVVKDAKLNVQEVMRTSLITVDVEMDQESVVHVFKKYNLLALPVIDMDKRMLGIITADSVIDVLDKEASEDMLKLSGIPGGEESHDMSIFYVMKRRLKWLSINILLNVLAASIIAFYQNTLQAVIALAVFLPIISDMSGCSGMQAVVISVRELALGKIDSSDFKKILLRELFIGFINGLALGLQIGAVAFFWKRIPGLGLVVALALWINTTLSVCLGSMLPLILKKLKIDPAIASGPVLTTITDMMGFFLVLFLATKFLWLLV
ncbi:MAG: magnesium transporter [bacterium]